MFKNISDEEIKKLTFEDSYKKLEEIVKTLENKDSSLEESIDYYDLGVRLKNHCDEYSLENRDTLINFLNASEEAKVMMSESNEVWEKIKPSMNAENEETFLNLKEAYREGIPQEFATKQIEGASKLFKTLSTIGGKELVGNSSEMADGTFWIK